MSEFIRTLNAIKKHRNIEWLTTSQSQTFAVLKKMLRAPGTVNLCGPAGAGKTFLTWVLADELNYAYFPCLKQFLQAEKVIVPGVIVDNNQPDRRSHRSVLKALQFSDVTHAVLVTRELIDDYTHYAELRFSAEDWEKICHNLSSIGCFSPKELVPNAWYLVNPYLRRP